VSRFKRILAIRVSASPSPTIRGNLEPAPRTCEGPSSAARLLSERGSEFAGLPELRGKRGIDQWQSLALLAPLARDGSNPWEGASDFDEIEALVEEPLPGLAFYPLLAEAQRAKTFESWSKSLAAANDRICRAEERVRRETAQYEQQKSQSMISVGATLLGAFFGRKVASASNVGRATTAARGMSRAAREKNDVGSAEEALRAARDELMALEQVFQKDAAELGSLPEPEALGLLDVPVKPRKADTVVERVALVWVPG
jgi:hypothetical protein